MVVHVPLPAVLLRHVLMGHVDVVHLRVVVLVGVGGEEVAPVLTSMEVVGDVEVLVTMLDGVVVMVTLCLSRHRASFGS